MRLISEFSISNFTKMALQRRKPKAHTRKVKGKVVKVNYEDSSPKITKVKIKDSVMLKNDKYYNKNNLDKNQVRPKSVVAYEVIDTPIRKAERASSVYKNIVSPTSRMIDSVSSTSKVLGRSQSRSRGSGLDSALKAKRLFNL